MVGMKQLFAFLCPLLWPMMSQRGHFPIPTHGEARYSEEILTLNAEGRPLSSVVPKVITGLGGCASGLKK